MRANFRRALIVNVPPRESRRPGQFRGKGDARQAQIAEQMESHDGRYIKNSARCHLPFARRGRAPQDSRSLPQGCPRSGNGVKSVASVVE
jgi:hypothetical protein